jgi:hypothetical protein
MNTDPKDELKEENEEKKPCPDELIKKHSADPDHIITDDDINTLRTDEGCK